MTAVPGVHIDLACSGIRRTAAGPLGPFPIIDKQGRFWGPDDVRKSWRALAAAAMTAAIDRAHVPGEAHNPMVYEVACVSLEASVREAAAGALLALAIGGARLGFVDAAVALWYRKTREETEAAFARAPHALNAAFNASRYRLEAEAVAWCGTPLLTSVNLDAVSRALADARPPASPPAPEARAVHRPRRTRAAVKT